MASLEALTGAATSALAVVAHPDDESFGLGAILAGLTRRGVAVRVLCFTHGEASTLGADTNLAEVRAHELSTAGAELGVEAVTLLDYPDGHLSDVPTSTLEREVEAVLGDADLMVVFEPGGVTGHPDHQAATAAAVEVAGRSGRPVLQWGLPPEVAEALNTEFGTGFVSTQGVDVDVKRAVQSHAIGCHRSQATDNAVLRRRLELLGGRERVRLHPAPGRTHAPPRPDGTFAPTPEAHPVVQ